MLVQGEAGPQGKRRLRAFAPADTYHKTTWSRGYDYVTVR